jgi:stalled ribosome rescue protein Dom34
VKHAIVWIDKHEARIFAAESVAADQSAHTDVTAPGPHAHRHPKDQEVRVRNHPDDEPRFFHAVAQALEGPEQILITGPAQAKLHLYRYLQQHARSIESRVVGIETLDHPTDAQLAAHSAPTFTKPARASASRARDRES